MNVVAREILQHVADKMDGLTDKEKVELAKQIIETPDPYGTWEEIEVIANVYDICGVKTWASKMKCDQCGFTTFAIERNFSQYNFCPNCGAKMESWKAR